ncbi:homing endonuclease associated repeat-containing protein [Haloferax sulfurifontis]|uniref:homing endonuclease associated repeat-containing protein n=1 Tax=Haloferax sulfurifontis TaxID=255616 RepID=UPI00227D44B9|nr:hypothetical protein [Haloferax sulfurifontis]
MTREDVLDEIRRVASELGLEPGDAAPTVEDLSEHGEMSLHSILHHFDTWNGAVSAAGFTPNEGRPSYTPEYGDMDLLKEIRRVADEMAETPTTDEFESRSQVGTTTIEQRFGSWHRALKLAGLRPRRQSPGGTPRGSSTAVDVNRVVGGADAPRIDRVSISAGGTRHPVSVGDFILDKWSPLLSYEVVDIRVGTDALAPIWEVVTTPTDLEAPLTRTFYGDELAEWIQHGYRSKPHVSILHSE